MDAQCVIRCDIPGTESHRLVEEVRSALSGDGNAEEVQDDSTEDVPAVPVYYTKDSKYIDGIKPKGDHGHSGLLSGKCIDCGEPSDHPIHGGPYAEIRYSTIGEEDGTKEVFLDEVVARNPQNFHMEAMSDEYYWFCLTLRDGRRIAWDVGSKSGRAHVRAFPIEMEDHR